MEQISDFIKQLYESLPFVAVVEIVLTFLHKTNKIKSVFIKHIQSMSHEKDTREVLQWNKNRNRKRAQK